MSLATDRQTDRQTPHNIVNQQTVTFSNYKYSSSGLHPDHQQTYTYIHTHIYISDHIKQPQRSINLAKSSQPARYYRTCENSVKVRIINTWIFGDKNIIN